MALTLEDYRIEIIEQLKAARATARAHELLAEVDMVLASARLSTAAQEAFWDRLNSDLDILFEESRLVLGREAAALGAVIAAAQGAVLMYRRLLESDEEAKSAD